MNSTILGTFLQKVNYSLTFDCLPLITCHLRSCSEVKPLIFTWKTSTSSKEESKLLTVIVLFILEGICTLRRQNGFVQTMLMYIIYFTCAFSWSDVLEQNLYLFWYK